ncbi:MAG: hypothetical protein COB24_07445 [Hyphomicrobiales bacterium]|nr:MAG: hypothetical protein COB24_07445 [Hyphomicrobiales bacterium]
MKTVLITAYDINPYKGSEAGTGWRYPLMISSEYNVIAITRKNNKQNIEKYITEHNIDVKRLRFEYYDLPYFLRFWKKGARGSGIYFYLWQLFMPIFILKSQLKADVYHNLNFHADAFPTLLWVFKKPLIWGPINHNERIPKQYVDSSKEKLKWMAKLFFWNFDPFLWLAKRNSDLILGGNSSVKKRLRIDDKKFVAFSQVGGEKPVRQDKELGEKSSEVFQILVIGRFIEIKSFDLAIRAFEKFVAKLPDTANVQLTIIGKGPLEAKLKAQAAATSVHQKIVFIDWLNPQELNDFYASSDVFLFPSHEGAGMVVVEALSFGLPVVCFDNSGPGELVGGHSALKIKYTNPSQSVEDYSIALEKLYSDKNLYNKLSKAAIFRFDEKYNWQQKQKCLLEIYKML